MSHTPIKYRIWSEEQDQEKSRQSRAGRQYEWAVQECPVHQQEAERRPTPRFYQEAGRTGLTAEHSIPQQKQSMVHGL